MSLSSVLSALSRLFKKNNSLTDIFGDDIGSIFKVALSAFIDSKVEELVNANFADPEALAEKLASDVNAVLDPIYKRVAPICKKITPGGDTLVVSLAKTYVYDWLLSEVKTKLGSTNSKISGKISDLIKKATKL